MFVIWAEELWLWQGLTGIAALGAAWEWGRLAGLSGRAAAIYPFLSGAFMAGGKMALDASAAAADAFLFFVCVFWVTGALFMMLSKRKWRRVPLCTAGMILIFAAWYAAAALFANNIYALLAVLATVWVKDTGAYLVGRRWGRTPLAPVISPNKTWEGTGGGIGAVLLLAVLILAYEDGPFVFNEPHAVYVLSAALMLAVFALIGDLFESSLKRAAGVKDSGTILGSHGGALDRLDSLLPALPFGMLIAQ